MTSIPSDIDRTPVAKDIFCFSPKEKAMTWHVVINHDANGYVDRVQCKVTGQVHKYKRQNKPAAAAKATSITRRAPGSNVLLGKSVSSSAAKKMESSAVLEETWFAGIKAWGTKVVTNFDPAKSFEKRQVLEHAVFGKGVVQARRDNKIDVLFKEGVKTLPSPKPELKV